MEQGEAVRRREAEKRKNEARRRRQKKRKRQQMFARSVMVLTGAVFVGVILYGGWRLSHGTYVQMLTENYPNFRGAASLYGLDYVPGAWMVHSS